MTAKLGYDHVPILQVPQLVRIGDHQADDQCDMKRTKLNIRHANVENPVHQKHINERRQLRTVNQTENT
ncbi:unnamed protein product [Echinostoma caproni]|uniref:Uncharacterized protein n=1 Tax=Echinostoma caproni TaxID=27848 RepID=A0A183B3S2_9TREM|nr:unnamed protein product [Echinostoma caproni]